MIAERGLRLSGPTPLPDAVRRAASRQMISHRSPGFREVVRDVTYRLKPVFGTGSWVLPFTASGTGGLEAAIVNAVDPGDPVLSLSAGFFGERFAEVARHHGAAVHSLNVPWGEALEPEMVREQLSRRRFAAVLVTHNETSTGVLNPVAEICRAIRAESDALVLIDAVSSAAAVPVELERWGADAAVGVTQKALMAPPGLALLAVGERLLRRSGSPGRGRFYFDLGRMVAAVEEGTTTYTPAISIVFALQAALDLIDEEGLEAVFGRHACLADLCRSGLAEIGCEPIASPSRRSPTVTAVRLPRGHSAPELRWVLERDHGLLVAQGRGKWKETVLRIGHMGYVDEEAIRHVIASFAAEVAGG